MDNGSIEPVGNAEKGKMAQPANFSNVGRTSNQRKYYKTTLLFLLTAGIVPAVLMLTSVFLLNTWVAHQATCPLIAPYPCEQTTLFDSKLLVLISAVALSFANLFVTFFSSAVVLGWGKDAQSFSYTKRSLRRLGLFVVLATSGGIAVAWILDELLFFIGYLH